ncbi:MAG: hypothetical protein KDC34_11640 [Saprospiraceae bacterium]|nr:hypothetical protein [Saprospiraceae bacterium]
MTTVPAKITRIFTLFLVLGTLLFTACKEEPKTDWKRTGNEQIIRLESEPAGINPVLMVFDRYSAQVIGDLFQYLMEIDPKTMMLSPVLIKAAPVVEEITSGPLEGGTIYHFDILDEAVWDDGKPITGYDYAFTIKTIMNPVVPAQQTRPYFESLADVQVDPENPKKFSVYMKEKYILAEEVLVGAAPVMPAHLFDPEGLMSKVSIVDLVDTAKTALLESDPDMIAFADLFSSDKYNRDIEFLRGSGAYKVVEWESGQRLVLEKKADWWGDALSDQYSGLKAIPDKIIYKPVPDVVAAATLTRSESFDIVPLLDSKDFSSMRQEEQMQNIYEFYTPTQMMFYLTYINTKDERLNDKRVRRAFAHLMNLDEIIETLFFGLGERIIGPIHPSKDYYNRDLKPIDFNTQKASELLTEAGWIDSNGNGVVDKEINGELVEMRIEYLTTQTPASQNIALLFIENARKVGVEVQLVTKDFQTWKDEMNNRNYLLAGAGLGAQPILDDLYQIWHTSSDTPTGFNRMGFGNARSDQILEDIRVTLDKPKRDALYRELQEIIYDEQPVIFLLAPQGRVMVHKRWDSFTSAVRPGYFPRAYELK